MSDDNATKIVCAFMLAIGLVLNGCHPGNNINEYSLIDETELAKGMAEGACYMSGRVWKHGECK